MKIKGKKLKRVRLKIRYKFAIIYPKKRGRIKKTLRKKAKKKKINIKRKRGLNKRFLLPGSRLNERGDSSC